MKASRSTLGDWVALGAVEDPFARPGPMAEAEGAAPFVATIEGYSLPSAGNLREHHRVRTARVKGQRSRTHFALWKAARSGQKIPPPPHLVVMTRSSPRELDDDNLATAMKAIRDETARFMGLKDDRQGPHLEWEPRQVRGKPYVRIEISTMKANENHSQNGAA